MAIKKMKPTESVSETENTMDEMADDVAETTEDENSGNDTYVETDKDAAIEVAKNQFKGMTKHGTSEGEFTEQNATNEATQQESMKYRVKQAKVTVQTVRDHQCYIGGVWYTFTKGVPQEVPESVKAILKRAGLLAVT